MAVKKILKIPNNSLQVKCAPFVEFGPATKKLAQDLLDTVLDAKDPEGAGLAAPQLGLPMRACVVRRFAVNTGGPGGSTTTNYVLFNPVMKSASKEKEIGWEACLSIPDTYAQVERHLKVRIDAQDAFGKKISLDASGFFARVIQHELDHLNGVLITDKVMGKILSDQEFDELIKKADAE